VTRSVVIVGQGYVGLPLSIRAVAAGYDTWGYDLDESKIAALGSGQSIVGDVSDQQLTDALASGRYHPTTAADDLPDFDVAVISVPTPLREGAPDLSYIESASRSLAEHLTAGATVVLESTTWPGTTVELVGPLLEEGSGLIAGTDFHLGYSPERIDPGNAVHRLENTPKVVSGVNPGSLEKVAAFYRDIVDEVVEVASTQTAELTKLLENTFRHVNIALVNELAMYAHDLDIDVWEAIDAASTKPFGYMRFTPGPGVGGHCLPVDPSYLSWRVKHSLGLNFRFVELANDVNDHMPDYVARRITAALNDQERPVKGQRILLLGLAYKRNTSDARESPSADVARALLDLGAVVVAADPHVIDADVPAGATRVDATPSELAAADVVVMLVDHDEFDADTVVTHSRYIFDCRRVLEGPNVERL
jgi:nucleotide sugar dehydrogenase